MIFSLRKDNMTFLALLFLCFSAFSQSFFGEGFSVKYEETSKSLIGKNIITIGQLDYKYPSHLRMETFKPHQAAIVINNEQAWHYQAPIIESEKGQVTITKGGSFQTVKLFDSMYSGLVSNETYSYSNDGKEITLAFKEKSKKDLGVESIILKSSKGTKNLKNLAEVEELVINQNDKKVKAIKFLEFKNNISFGSEYFVFQIPMNTKIRKE